MPSGATLRVRGVLLSVTGDDHGTPTECRLKVEMPPEVYGSLVVLGLFHLAPDNRGAASIDFSPTSTVRIESALDPGMLSELELAGGDADSIASFLQSTSDAGRWSPLLETESWYALHVTERITQDLDPDGELWTGYSTVFTEGIHRDPGLISLDLELPLLAALTTVLDERGIDWSETTDDEVVEAEVAGDSGSWTAYFVARQDEHRASVYSQVPWSTPESARNAMAELITRINYGLSIGNFEMDFSDGEIRFKTSIEIPPGTASRDLVENLLSPNFGAMDTYLPALEAVRDGRLDPEAAVRSVESG